MTDFSLKSAIVNFEIDYEVANGMYEAAIADAVSALEFPASKPDLVARSKIEDLHADVRDAIEAGSTDYHCAMNRAWRAFKQALRETAES
jgi:hypothetical protein